MLDQDEAVAADAVAPEAPPPPRPTRFGFATTVVGVFLAVGLLLLAAMRLSDDGSSEELATPVWAMGTLNACTGHAGPQGDQVVSASIGDLLRCLQYEDVDEWPLGVFDTDGTGFEIAALDGDPTARLIRGCNQHRRLHPVAEIESFGVVFRFGPDGFHAGTGDATVEPFEAETVDGMIVSGMRISGGTEPDADDPIPDLRWDEVSMTTVFDLVGCGVDPETAVRMIEARITDRAG